MHAAREFSAALVACYAWSVTNERRFWWAAIAVGLWGSFGGGACSCSDSGGAADAGGDAGDAGGDAAMGPEGCAEGVVICDGDRAQVCDGQGAFAEVIDCAADGLPCVDSQISQITGELLPLGCVQCVPGDASCDGGAARYCREDGSGYLEFECDPEQGLTCEPEGCKGACAPPEVTASYIGCDYYPTVTLNSVWQGFDFAVAIANASSEAASVHITRGLQTVDTLEVAAGALRVVPLPWVSALKGDDVDACQFQPDPGDTRIVADGAYRVRSDRPVTVYQLSPLQYQKVEDGGGAPAGCPVGADCPGGGIGTECLSFSNDASLLLPATTLGGDYATLAWPSAGRSASFLAVTATADGTRVRFEGEHARIRAGAGIAADGTGEVMLDRGDVLQLLADHAVAPGADGFGEDLSGLRVRATRPVQVIAGNSCANAPTPSTGYCDHVEHAQWPSEILGTEYVAGYPAAPASSSPYVLRLSAVESDTRVRFDPPVHPEVVLQPGEAPLQVQVGNFERDAGGAVIADEPAGDVHISASQPLVVAQYLQGERAVPSGAGDPSMAMVVPVAQYRRDYTFFASSTYDHSFINLVVMPGTTPRLDGEPVDATPVAVGASGWQVMRVELADTSEVHRIEADAPFGLVVYGYGRFTSYMYPGGLDLRRIAPLSPQ